MKAVQRPPNRLLQALPPAEFLSLYPHLENVELTKGAVLARAGAPIQQVYLPHTGVVSIMVGLSEGQTVEVAMIGRDSLVSASAALDDGPSLTDAIVVVPGTRFGLEGGGFARGRPTGAARSENSWRDIRKPCSCRRCNPPLATRLTRSSRDCRACCCARDLCAREGLPFDPRNFWPK